MLDQMLQKKGQEVDRVLDFQVPDGLLVSEAAGLAHAGVPGPEWAVVLSLSVWRPKSGAVSVCMLRWALFRGLVALQSRNLSRRTSAIRALAAH